MTIQEKIKKLKQERKEISGLLKKAIKTKSDHVVILQEKITTLDKEIKIYQQELKKKVGKGCALFVVIGIVLIVVVAIIGASLSPTSDDIVNSSSSSDDILKYNKDNDTLHLGEQTIKNLIGKKIPYDKIPQWGSIDGIASTNARYFIGHMAKANISLLSKKSNDKVLYAFYGNNPQGLKDLIDKAIHDENSKYNTSKMLILCSNYFDEKVATYEGSKMHTSLGATTFSTDTYFKWLLTSLD